MQSQALLCTLPGLSWCLLVASQQHQDPVDSSLASQMSQKGGKKQFYHKEMKGLAQRTSRSCCSCYDEGSERKADEETQHEV